MGLGLIIIVGRRFWICLIVLNEFKDVFKDIFDYFNFSVYIDVFCKKNYSYFFLNKLIVMEYIYRIDIWIVIIYEFVMNFVCIFVENVDIFLFYFDL